MQDLTQLLGGTLANPSAFEDAEISRIYLDRSGAGKPSLVAEIHGFRNRMNPDAKSVSSSPNRMVVILRFTEVAIETLRWTKNPSPFSELGISILKPADALDSAFDVGIASSLGSEAHFECGSFAVEDVCDDAKYV